MRGKLRLVIAGIVVVLVTGGYYLVRNGNGKKEDAAAGQVQRIVSVTRGNLNLVVSADGVVQPINKVEVRSKAGGEIVELNFIDGQYVQKGDLLLLVDQTTTRNDLDQAKADLEVAKANLVQAENNSHRTKELAAKNLVSSQDVDQANVDLVRSQASLVKAKAALSTSEDRMKDTRIVAPVTGIVLSKNVEKGQIISSATSNVGGGTLLATVANMDEVYVVAKVDEVDIGRVQVGQAARVVADAFPDDTFNGRVIRIDPEGVTQQNVTTFDVIILVRNESGKLKAGMSASVDVEVFNRQNVLLAPNEALKDPKSEQGRALLASAGLTLPPDPPAAGDSAGRKGAAASDDGAKRRERFMNMTPEEREKARAQMQERFAKMSPEEREKARESFRQRFAQGGGQSGGQVMIFQGEGDAQSPANRHRKAQVSGENQVRWRIAVVKNGNDATPRLVKSGASNFDMTEIVDGLVEGDQLQVNTVSRAKLASEQLNERMRSMNTIGGSSRGATAGRR